MLPNLEQVFTVESYEVVTLFRKVKDPVLCNLGIANSLFVQVASVLLATIHVGSRVSILGLEAPALFLAGMIEVFYRS